MASDLQRAHLVGLGNWLISKAALIDYAQRRPMRSSGLYEQDLADRFKAGTHLVLDCSESVTLMFRMAGLKDPNGFNYNGDGNTTSMYNALGHYTDPKRAKAGALVIYQNPAHVSMVLTAGADPWLFSHGSTNGPIGVALSVERTWHSGTVTFLDVSRL